MTIVTCAALVALGAILRDSIVRAETTTGARRWFVLAMTATLVFLVSISI